MFGNKVIRVSTSVAIHLYFTVAINSLTKYVYQNLRRLKKFIWTFCFTHIENEFEKVVIKNLQTEINISSLGQFIGRR